MPGSLCIKCLSMKCKNCVPSLRFATQPVVRSPSLEVTKKLKSYQSGILDKVSSMGRIVEELIGSF